MASAAAETRPATVTQLAATPPRSQRMVVAAAPAAEPRNRIALVGTWFDKEIRVDKSETFRTGLKPLHPAWKVHGQWPDDNDPTSCLVGRRLADQ